MSVPGFAAGLVEVGKDLAFFSLSLSLSLSLGSVMERFGVLEGETGAGVVFCGEVEDDGENRWRRLIARGSFRDTFRDAFCDTC